MGRKLKVQEISDDSRMGRVRVPEKIVAYVLGNAKRRSSAGSNNSHNRKKNRRPTNTMRRIARLENAIQASGKSNGSPRSSSPSSKKLGLEGRADSGSDLQTKPRAFERPQFVLKASEQEEMGRATRRGYISLEGSATKGYTRRRCTQSRLAAAHRHWCDERGIPHIVHCKASDNNNFNSNGSSGGNNSQLLDCVIVDLSPLRVHTDGGGVTSDDFDVNDFLVRWKAQIATAAAMTGMELRRPNFKQENYEMLSALDEEDDDDDYLTTTDYDDLDDDDECMMLSESCEDDDEEETIKLSADGAATDAQQFVLELSDEDSWNTDPISRLPILSMGIFEGERSQAKAMAKELAQLWGTADTSSMDDEDDDDPNDLFQTVDSDINLPSYGSELERQPALYSTQGNSRNNNNGNNSNGPSRRHRKRENRRQRRRNNSPDLDLKYIC
jgi:hypothetical protein